MKKEDALKYCLYYKGEEEIPEREKFECTDEEYEMFRRFWFFEREYFAGKIFTRGEYWNTEGVRMLQCIEGAREFINDPKWDKNQRGFLAYMAICPPDFPDWIINYGKCTNLKRKPEPKPKPKTAWEGMMEICRYYRGGKINPYPWGTAKAHFWELEWEFANDYFQKQPSLEREYDSGFSAAFPDQLSKAPYGAIFRPLKAFLHARYYNSGGSDAGFPAYLDYYLENQ